MSIITYNKVISDIRQALFTEIRDGNHRKRPNVKQKLNREIIAYLVFGILTTAVSIAVFWILSKGMDPLLANGFSWILSVAFAYITNRKWVFQSKAEDRQILKECINFYAGRLSTLALEEIILYVGISLLHISQMPVKLVAQVLVIVGNYVISKLFIFKSKV